jgi:O-antigen/teichoic acid export membrane protein
MLPDHIPAPAKGGRASSGAVVRSQSKRNGSDWKSPGHPPDRLVAVRSLAYMALAVVAVQGTTYLFHLAIAILLGPEEFGIVRTVDSVLGVFVIIGSAGMPSLAVKCIAEVHDTQGRWGLLRRLLVIAAGASSLASWAAYGLAPWLADVNAFAYLQRLVWIIPLAACARTTLNYYQGAGEIRRYSMLSASVACGVLLPSLVAVSVGGLRGWIWARYGTEAVTFAAGLLPLIGVLPDTGRLAPAFASWRLARVGSVLSLSLLTRTSIDNLGTLALVAAGAPMSQIGYYGIGVLVALGLLILPACVGNIALPKLVQNLHDAEALRAEFYRTMRMSLALTVPFSILGIIIGPSIVWHFFPAYMASVPVIRALLLTVPARALTTVSGTLLVALDQGNQTLVANILILSLGAVLMLYLTPTFGIAGAAWATVGVEAASLCVYGFLARRVLSGCPTSTGLRLTAT